ncbi:MAG: acyl-CoA dehydrogenase family protein [Polyangiales bacterium]
MQLVLTEDQTMLARTADAFVAEHSPLTRLRKLRDSGDARGYSPAIYKRMAELGWTAIPFAEQDGGLGMGMAEVILVTEALGRALAPEPLIPSVVLAGHVLAAAGGTAHKRDWLAPAIAGDKVLALAWEEHGTRFDPARIGTTAERTAAGYRLSGQKPLVWGGQGADAFVVAARTAGASGDRDGLALFLVPATTRGLSSRRQIRVDSQSCASLTLEGVEVPASDVLDAAGAGYPLLASALDRATVALCGEMLGGMGEAFARTLAYLKERKQFGVPIGSFQALKHRAAKIFIEIELSRSVVMAAARALDEGSSEAPQLVSMAKARLSDAYCLIANEAVQMHGGIGMTDEHDIGFFIKRARGCEMTFGDAAYHRGRFAALGGF